jgi:hypothetical protein
MPRQARLDVPGHCTIEEHIFEDNYGIALSNRGLRGAEIGRLMGVGYISGSQKRRRCKNACSAIKKLSRSCVGWSVNVTIENLTPIV